MSVGPGATGRSNTKADETMATVISIMGAEKYSTNFTGSMTTGQSIARSRETICHQKIKFTRAESMHKAQKLSRL